MAFTFQNNTSCNKAPVEAPSEFANMKLNKHISLSCFLLACGLSSATKHILYMWLSRAVILLRIMHKLNIHLLNFCITEGICSNPVLYVYLNILGQCLSNDKVLHKPLMKMLFRISE